MPREPLPGLCLTFFSCLAGSVAAGVLAYGGRVFEPALPHFQFVASGAIGGALVVAERARSARGSLLAGVASFACMSALVGSTDPYILARNAAWIAGLLLAVRASLRLDRLLPRVAVGKFASWSVVFGLFHAALYLVPSLVRSGSVDAGAMLLQATIGALIGAGIGLGHELAVLPTSRTRRAHAG